LFSANSVTGGEKSVLDKNRTVFVQMLKDGGALMKTRTVRSRMLALLAAVSFVLIGGITASAAPFHNQTDCTACHDFESFDCGTYRNLEAIACTIAGQSVQFTVRPDHYADGLGSRICEVCHTATTYYRNADSVPGANGHQVGADCSTCHSHCDEFAASGGTGLGHEVHTTANVKFGTPLDCADCHGASFDIFKDGEPLATTTVCDTCHSPGGAFNGVDSTGGSVGAKDNWPSGETSLIYDENGKLLPGSEHWCAGCHDGGTAFSQPVLIPDVIVDNEDSGLFSTTGTWLTYSASCVYVGSNFHYRNPGVDSYSATWQVPSSFIAGTYNVYAIWCGISNRENQVYYTINRSGGSDVAGPFDQRTNNGQWVLLGTYAFDAGSGSVVLSGSNNDGIVHAEAIKFENVEYVGAFAPNVVGDNSTYGYYVNGHKLTCTVCHDAGLSHIDHNQRTYEVDEATKLAVNPYEAGYRLRELSGQRPMVIPRLTGSLDPSRFTLCFKCHDSNAILQRPATGTNFYNNDSTPDNSHWYHLRMNGAIWDSDWDAVIGGVNGASLESSFSCTTCHNIHGSGSATMIRRGELISTYGTTNKVPAVNFCYLDGVASRNCSIVNPYPVSVGGGMIFSGYPEGGNAVCKACHTGNKYYYRAAKDIAKPTNPVVSLARAVPSNAANNGTSPVLLTALVVDPNENLSTVVVNLSPLGGSSVQAMYDDGTHGDQIAGEDTYSYLLSGTTVAVGNYTVTITATDSGSNTGIGNIDVIVHNEPGVYIVDNKEVVYTASKWAAFSGPPLTDNDYFGPDFQYTGAGTGLNTATWGALSSMPAGTYRVYVQWAAYTNRATNVYYTINHFGGSTVVGPFNQTLNSGTWIDLGGGTQVFTFSEGTGSVVVTDNANGVVVADAIKWQPVP
jgi:hypothetical protein